MTTTLEWGQFFTFYFLVCEKKVASRMSLYLSKLLYYRITRLAKIVGRLREVMVLRSVLTERLLTFTKLTTFLTCKIKFLNLRFW